MTMMKIVSSYWIHVWMCVTMYSIHTSSLTWHAKILLQLFKNLSVSSSHASIQAGGGEHVYHLVMPLGPPRMPRMCSLRIASQRRCVLVAFR